MIKEIVAQWDERKHLLAEWLREQHPESYEELTRELVARVLTGDLRRDFTETPLDPERIAVVDHGDYQGVEIFLIPLNTYQPDAGDYVWFDNYYGSCSGCDTLQGISGYSDDKPTESQVSEYMYLALHMVQRMKWLVSDPEAP